MSDPFERIADEWDSPAWKSAAAAYHADREPIKAHASRIVPLNGGRVNQLTPETTESAPLIKSSKEFVPDLSRPTTSLMVYSKRHFFIRLPEQLVLAKRQLHCVSPQAPRSALSLPTWKPKNGACFTWPQKTPLTCGCAGLP